MGYIKIDFEELLVKTWRDCTKDYLYVIPMLISVLLPLISIGLFFKFFVDYNYLLLFVAIFMFVVSLVFQTWYFTTAKYLSHGKKFEFSSSFSESLLQIPRFIAMYLVWLFMLLITVVIMILSVVATILFFKESIVLGVFFLLITVAVLVAGVILIIVYIFANIYLMPILFIDKDVSCFKVPFVAMKYCLNKKLETFIFLLIMMAFVYAAMTPTYIFGFFNKSMMGANGVPVVLVSVFFVVAMFNFYLMQKKKMKDYEHKGTITSDGLHKSVLRKK
jgi:hypothetical protein